jgi:hypothetical protein
MSNPVYFRQRATAYKQLALVAGDGSRAEGLFDVANMFNRMADDLRALQSLRPPERLKPRLLDVLRDKLVFAPRGEAGCRVALASKP